MGTKGSPYLQSTTSGQMNPNNLSRSNFGTMGPTNRGLNPYGATNMMSGYSPESEGMQMVYGQTSPQSQNPYMYKGYGSMAPFSFGLPQINPIFQQLASLYSGLS